MSVGSALKRKWESKHACSFRVFRSISTELKIRQNLNYLYILFSYVVVWLIKTTFTFHNPGIYFYRHWNPWAKCDLNATPNTHRHPEEQEQVIQTMSLRVLSHNLQVQSTSKRPQQPSCVFKSVTCAKRSLSPVVYTACGAPGPSPPRVTNTMTSAVSSVTKAGMLFVDCC